MGLDVPANVYERHKQIRMIHYQ